MRRLALLSLLIAAPTLAPSVLADAVTTRIETRPYYGAVVTIEQGVRVWRALPPHDRIIIVPEGAKNVRVNVNVGDHKPAPPVTVNSNVRINQSNHDGGGAGVVGIPYGYGHGRGHGYSHGPRVGSPAPMRRH